MKLHDESMGATHRIDYRCTSTRYKKNNNEFFMLLCKLAI